MNGSITRPGLFAEDGGAYLDKYGPKTAIVTWAGHAFDVCQPETWYDAFDLTDISLALSNTCRFQGQVDFYSVAEHAIRVSYWLLQNGHDRMTQLLGLHHDDTEAYLGDIPSPQKGLMTIWDMSFRDFEGYMERVYLWPWLEIDYTDERWAAVKEADWAIYLEEREQRPSPRTPGSNKAMAPRVAQTNWLGRHYRLKMEIMDGMK